MSLTKKKSALSCLSDSSLDHSAFGHLVVHIKSVMINRVFISRKLHRSQNSVVDCLARYSRSERATTVWLGRGPPCIEKLLQDVDGAPVQEKKTRDEDCSSYCHRWSLLARRGRTALAGLSIARGAAGGSR